MEKESQAAWDAMTHVARLGALPLSEDQAQASLAPLDKQKKKKAKAAAPADPPWKKRGFLERLRLVVGDDEALAKRIVESPDHLAAERQAMFALGQAAWKKRKAEEKKKTKGKKGKEKAGGAAPSNPKIMAGAPPPAKKAEVHETAAQKSARVIKEIVLELGQAEWKSLSPKHRLKKIELNDTQAQKILQNAPPEVKKKARKKAGKDKWMKMSLPARVKKLRLDDKDAKKLVKGVPQKLRAAVHQKLGKAKWEAMDEPERIKLIAAKDGSASAEAKKKGKVKCPHCDVHIHEQHLQRHIDVMHPLGGTLEEEEQAEADANANEQDGTADTGHDASASDAALHASRKNAALGHISAFGDRAAQKALRRAAAQKKAAARLRMKKGLEMIYMTFSEKPPSKKERAKILKEKDALVEEQRAVVAEAQAAVDKANKEAADAASAVEKDKAAAVAVDEKDMSKSDEKISAGEDGGAKEVAAPSEEHKDGKHGEHGHGKHGHGKHGHGKHGKHGDHGKHGHGSHGKHGKLKKEPESNAEVAPPDEGGTTSPESVGEAAQKDAGGDIDGGDGSGSGDSGSGSGDSGTTEDASPPADTKSEEEKDAGNDVESKPNKKVDRKAPTEPQQERQKQPEQQQRQSATALLAMAESSAEAAAAAAKTLAEAQKELEARETAASSAKADAESHGSSSTTGRRMLPSGLGNLVIEAWASYSLIDPAFVESAGPPPSTPEAGASILLAAQGDGEITMPEGSSCKQFVEWCITRILAAAKQRIQAAAPSMASNFFHALAALSSSPAGLRASLCETKAHRRHRLDAEANAKRVAERDEALRKKHEADLAEERRQAEEDRRLFAFSSERWTNSLRGRKVAANGTPLRDALDEYDEDEDAESEEEEFDDDEEGKKKNLKKKKSTRRPGWNFETLPAYDYPEQVAEERGRRTHHRRGALEKPQDVPVNTADARRERQALYEKTLLEAHANARRYRPPERQPKAMMQKKMANVQHRLNNNDDGRHKWRHIWLRAEHSSPESLKRSLIHEEHINLGMEQGELDDADICPGLVSPLLVNARAPEDDNAYGRWGPTALIAALKGRKFDNVLALLGWGANPLISDRNGVDGWFWACEAMRRGSGLEHEAQEILTMMIDKWPDLATCDISDGEFFCGGKALHAAARFGQEHAIAYLLSRGADGAARYDGGTDDGLSACIVARKNGHLTAAKMLKIFAEDDWNVWTGGLPAEAKWLRITGKQALGRKVRVLGHGGNEQWIEGEVDDYDPLRGLHHVQFNISTAGSWEGWFALDDARCRIIDSEGQTMTMLKSPSPPKTSRNPRFDRGGGRKHVSFAGEDAGDDFLTNLGFGAVGREERREHFESSGMISSMVGQETALDQARKPQFQRSAVADAFERQMRSLAAL
jgi:hypothetical protein